MCIEELPCVVKPRGAEQSSRLIASFCVSTSRFGGESQGEAVAGCLRFLFCIALLNLIPHVFGFPAAQL